MKSNIDRTTLYISGKRIPRQHHPPHNHTEGYILHLVSFLFLTHTQNGLQNVTGQNILKMYHCTFHEAYEKGTILLNLKQEKFYDLEIWLELKPRQHED